MKKITDLKIYERAKKEGMYIIQTGATVRQVAKDLKISKSTVHRDVTQVLENNHDSLALEVRKVLEQNSSEMHIRGGEATKRKKLGLK